MIIFNKLGQLLKTRNMTWKDLCNAGLSQNMPTRFSKNENISSDTINKVCEYLCVQPFEIWNGFQMRNGTQKKLRNKLLKLK